MATFACSAIVGYGTLDEMAGVIEFVGVDLLPLVAAPPAAQARTFISNTGGQVAVGLLSLGDDVDDGVEIMVQFGIVVHGQTVRGTLDDLVGVGIVEREVTLVFSLDESSGQCEVVEAAVHLTLVEG